MQSRDDEVLVVARVAQQRAVAAVAVGEPRDVLVRCVVRSRPTSDPIFSLGRPCRRTVTYRSGRRPGPPPKTQSRSSAAVRALGAVNGFCGTPISEVWSNVMSWSVNWPTNVEPAVIVGLSGLVPYGSVEVGLPLTLGSTIRFFGPAARSSCASSTPPCFPTSSSAARTVSFASANGGSPGRCGRNRYSRLARRRCRAGGGPAMAGAAPPTPQAPRRPSRPPNPPRRPPRPSGTLAATEPDISCLRSCLSSLSWRSLADLAVQ